MSELPAVVPGEPIDANTFGNPVVARVISRYNDPTERDFLNPSPDAGDPAYIISTGELQVFDGAEWQPYQEVFGDLITVEGDLPRIDWKRDLTAPLVWQAVTGNDDSFIVRYAPDAAAPVWVDSLRLGPTQNLSQLPMVADEFIGARRVVYAEKLTNTELTTSLEPIVTTAPIGPAGKYRVHAHSQASWVSGGSTQLVSVVMNVYRAGSVALGATRTIRDVGNWAGVIDWSQVVDVPVANAELSVVMSSSATAAVWRAASTTIVVDPVTT